MANLINATVYQIDGNPKDTSVVIAFDTNNIVVQAATVSTISAVNSFIEVKGAKLNAPPIRYYVGETVTALVALANTNGTTLVQATIASINDNPQKVNIQVALPANKVQIVAFSSGDINSYLQYGNDKYYATETKSTLVTAANTSSGGGGGVQTVTGFGVDNTDPLNPIVNKYQVDSVTSAGTNFATATQIYSPISSIVSGGNEKGVKLPSSPNENEIYVIFSQSTTFGFIVYSTDSFLNQMIVNNQSVSSFTISPNDFSTYTFRYMGGAWSVNQEQVAPYKVYSALLTNSSGTVTAIQLQNTIGNGSGDGTNDIAWTNPSNGIIRGTMSAGTPFPTNKTWAVSPTLDQSSNAYFVGNKPYNFAPNNSYDFVIRLHDNTQSSTPNFTNLSIEIRVYN